MVRSVSSTLIIRASSIFSLRRNLILSSSDGLSCFKDYDCTIEYHTGKANVVADALSLRSMTDLRAIFARLILFDDDSLLAEL